jgi:hypothetical protein
MQGKPENYKGSGLAINFKLGPMKPLDPTEDDMGREWYGWDPRDSNLANFERNRGLWLLGARAERERYATFSIDGTIKVVAEIDGLETIPAKDPSRRAKRAIVGRVLEAGHPIADHFVQQPADQHRNPVTYLSDPDTSERTCACGCGTSVPGLRSWASGHDQRAVHDRITRQWGDVLGFVRWFDATYAERRADAA